MFRILLDKIKAKKFKHIMRRRRNSLSLEFATSVVEQRLGGKVAEVFVDLAAHRWFQS
jgi:hypothetical protein